MAVSLDADSITLARWDAAEWAVGKVIEMWPCGQASTTLLCNVNVPNRPAATLAGIRLTSLGHDSFLTQYQFERNIERSYAITATHRGGRRTDEPEMGTDAWAVKRGYVSLTPVEPLPELIRVVPWYHPVTRVEADQGTLGLPAHGISLLSHEKDHQGGAGQDQGARSRFSNQIRAGGGNAS